MNITTKIENQLALAKESATEARTKVGALGTDYLVTYSLVDALVNSDASLGVWHDVATVFNYEFAEIAKDNPDLPYEAMEDGALAKVIAELGRRLIEFHVPSSSSASSNQMNIAKFEVTQAIYRRVCNWR